MQGRKAVLILHGKQAMNDEVREAVRGMRERGWTLDVRVTWEAGDSQRFVDEAVAAGYTHVVAGGGDGTLRDVAEAVGLAATDASLALLPLGTANDFAKAAGIPLEPAAALALLEQPAKPIDLGQVGEQLFLNMATGGFGSQVTANTSEDLKKVLAASDATEQKAGALAAYQCSYAPAQELLTAYPLLQKACATAAYGWEDLGIEFQKNRV